MKKMRQLFFCSVFTLLSVSIAFGQNETIKLPIDSSTGKITYSEVVAMKDSVSKSELFARAKTCFVNLFKNSKEVIQNEDKENGIIIGKGNIRVNASALGTEVDGGHINFTLTIAVKKGRYKYTFTDFAHEGNGINLPSGGDLENGKPKNWRTKIWDSFLSQTDNEVKNMISSIKIEMNKTSPQNDNW